MIDKTRLLVVFVILVLLLGCGPDPDMQDSTLVPIGEGGLCSKMYRIVDEDAGVACWVWRCSYAGGIDCLPLEWIEPLEFTGD